MQKEIDKTIIPLNKKTASKKTGAYVM